MDNENSVMLYFPRNKDAMFKPDEISKALNLVSDESLNQSSGIHSSIVLQQEDNEFKTWAHSSTQKIHSNDINKHFNYMHKVLCKNIDVLRDYSKKGFDPSFWIWIENGEQLGFGLNVNDWIKIMSLCVGFHVTILYPDEAVLQPKKQIIENQDTKQQNTISGYDYVSLCITGKDIIPIEVTRLLGVFPSQTFYCGTTFHSKRWNKDVVRNMGIWQYNTEPVFTHEEINPNYSCPGNFYPHLNIMLSIFENLTDKLRFLMNKGNQITLRLWTIGDSYIGTGFNNAEWKKYMKICNNIYFGLSAYRLDECEIDKGTLTLGKDEN